LDERRHQWTDDRWWGEAWAFDFVAPDGRVGGYVRLELLPNQSLCWYWACVVGPDRSPVVVLDDEVPLPRGKSLELRTNGLWADHIVEEAFEHVSVGAEAFALRLDDPADVYGAPLGLPTPFGLDLGWETDGLLLDLPPGGAVEGYELQCAVVGEVLVGDERLPIDALGYRRHSWGVEDWWSAAWTTVNGVLDDGSWFDGSLPGRGAAPTDLGEHGFPTTDRVFLAEMGPRGLDLVIEPLAFAPVQVDGGDGRVSRLARALCRFRDEPTGRSGFGWAEWNQPQG
jgi:hypothetical protein